MRSKRVRHEANLELSADGLAVVKLRGGIGERIDKGHVGDEHISLGLGSLGHDLDEGLEASLLAVDLMEVVHGDEDLAVSTRHEADKGEQLEDKLTGLDVNRRVVPGQRELLEDARGGQDELKTTLVVHELVEGVDQEGLEGALGLAALLDVAQDLGQQLDTAKLRELLEPVDTLGANVEGEGLDGLSVGLSSELLDPVLGLGRLTLGLVSQGEVLDELPFLFESHGLHLGLVQVGVASNLGETLLDLISSGHGQLLLLSMVVRRGGLGRCDSLVNPEVDSSPMEGELGLINVDGESLLFSFLQLKRGDRGQLGPHRVLARGELWNEDQR